MALRAFKTTVLVAIDEAEATSEGQREESAGEVTLDELKQYLRKALLLDMNLESCGNPVGFGSAEVLIDELTELSEAERLQRYSK